MDRETNLKLSKLQDQPQSNKAKDNSRCMEQEASDSLKGGLEEDAAPERGLGTALHELFKPFGGIELEIPPREPMRFPEFYDRLRSPLA